MIEVGRHCFDAHADAVGAARRFAGDHLAPLQLDRRGDDVDLVVTELATNAVIHARTSFGVNLFALPDGGRIEVSDGSSVLPAAGTLTDTALSGRGLVLVGSLSSRWGAERREPRGKAVWCELATDDDPAAEGPAAGAPGEGPADPVDVDALLAAWADEDDEGEGDAGPPGAALVDVEVPRSPVEPLLAAKVQMEDLLREVQLARAPFPRAAGVPAELQEVWLAARELEEAAAAFAEGRRQLRAQLFRARERGLATVTLRLRLPAGSRALVVRYRGAVEHLADVLARAPGASPFTTVPGPGELARHADARRHYLDAIVDGLATPADRRGPSDGVATQP